MTIETSDELEGSRSFACGQTSANFLRARLCGRCQLPCENRPGLAIGNHLAVTVFAKRPFKKHDSPKGWWVF